MSALPSPDTRTDALGAIDPLQVLVYADSLSWGIVPGTRQRLPWPVRWPARKRLRY